MAATSDTPPSDDRPFRRIKLGNATLIELSLVLLICGAIVAATRWATKVDYRLDSIDSKLDAGIYDRWRGADMRAWVLQANREVEVWSLEAEHVLGLEGDSWVRFHFPDPDNIRGSR